MKRNIFSILATMALIASLHSSAFATQSQEITDFVASEMAALNSGTPRDTHVTDNGFYLQKLSMRVRAPVGLKLPWVAKVEVFPELEVVMTRDLPTGMEAYRP